MKVSFENVNGVATLVSEKVHLDEIAVISADDRLGQATRCRSRQLA
jgi:hypothetical protein